ncbi:MAG TPA: glycosyltransferase family 2 protein [Candidatus Methylomirabilis sp.]|nr:glycosyltransferase family 2 protein [Candidatus Methylomirabilis sp.]
MNRRRFYEIIPGALVWITLTGSVALSFIRPLWMIYFVIVFDVYWLLRVAYYLPFLLVAWWRYRHDMRVDWQSKVQGMPGYERVRHLVFLPTYKEDLSIVRETFRNLLTSATPPDRMIVCVAGEERDRERFESIASAVRDEFGARFLSFQTTLHPADLPDEIPGKGSNLNWAAHQMIPVVESLGISPDDLIVSSFDIDSQAHPQYFARLTVAYLSEPNPTRCSYQPVALYNNNLWEAKAPVRVAMFGTTFWLMTEMARPEEMMTFSSHSMSWRMLLDVGFWQKDIVSEDSRIFLQGLIHYHGDYRVVPINLPVSMDSVSGNGYTASLKALYTQLRRWAWGVENLPYMAEAFAKDRTMPLGVKVSYLWKQIEGSYTWATAPLLITLLGQLPFWVAPERFRSFAVFQNTPFTLQWIMRFALVGVFVSAGLALTLLPPRPAYVPRSKTFAVAVLQWLLLPVTFVLFGSIPAVDAQTRFMLGGKFRLGFNVSAKRKVTAAANL